MISLSRTSCRVLRTGRLSTGLGVLMIHDIGGAGIANLDPRMPVKVLRNT